MARNFKNQLVGQIGESLVVVELGRRGVVATAFAGNVPDIDVVGYQNGSTIHLQVKTWRTGSVQFDAKQFIIIEFQGNSQVLKGKTKEIDGDLTYIFVRLGEKTGLDRFFILEQRELQQIIFEGYSTWLAKHNGVRPRNPKTTHCAASISDLEKYEDNWALVKHRLRRD